MGKPENVRCGTCVFFDNAHTSGIVCKRRAPPPAEKVIRMAEDSLTAMDRFVSVYAPTDEWDWCGEWAGEWPNRQPDIESAKEAFRRFQREPAVLEPGAPPPVIIHGIDPMTTMDLCPEVRALVEAADNVCALYETGGYDAQSSQACVFMEDLDKVRKPFREERPDGS